MDCLYKAGGGFDLIVRSMFPYLGKSLREMSRRAKGGDAIIRHVTEAGGLRGPRVLFIMPRPTGTRLVI